MNPEVPNSPIDYVPWVEHVYASLRWTEGSIRRLHELLEHETVDDTLRGKVAAVISWIEAGRLQAFHAFEKMGNFKSDPARAALDVSAIGNETKVRMLTLNADFMEALLGTRQAYASHESLIEVIQRGIKVMREQAAEISVTLKKGLDGPPAP